MKGKQDKIVNLAEAAEKYGVREYSLPGWESGEAFVCRMKRPSLYNMAAAGLVPNPLLGAVQTLFSRVKADIDAVSLENQVKAMRQMAKYALVEPTYQEITEKGLELTDEQLMLIYSFSVAGAAIMEAFRAGLCGGASEPVEDVPDATERPGED